jgi:hypothetical protein
LHFARQAYLATSLADASLIGWTGAEKKTVSQEKNKKKIQ